MPSYNENKNNLIISLYSYLSSKCKYGDDIDKLVPCEKIVYLCQAFEAEINNGGFREFFFYSTGDYTMETIDSLLVIGAHKTAKLLEMAISIFPSNIVPKDKNEREVVLDEIFNHEKEAILNKLDNSFYDGEDNLLELNYNHIISNRNKARIAALPLDSSFREAFILDSSQKPEKRDKHMDNLIKIKDVSSKYSITARTLRYYEDMGLISSTRSGDYAYRMYDENAVKRLEQILILRKLNISIKDIQRIFSTSSSNIVLEVLEKKVQNIDDEVALLHELKDIVLDFIHEIERVDFANNSDIKLLYDKAKELETQLINVDYIGKPSNINRLIEITEKLDKKIPDVMVVRIPRFKAVTTGDQLWGEMFKEGGYMNQLWQHCHLYKSVIFDCFDFLLSKDDKAEWICAVKEDVTNEDVSSFKLIDFPGGIYAMAVSIDEDNESINKVEDKVCRWIESTNFEIDKGRSVMFNMPYLYEDGRDIAYKDIEKGLGYKQMQRYFPIKLKDDFR